MKTAGNEYKYADIEALSIRDFPCECGWYLMCSLWISCKKSGSDLRRKTSILYKFLCFMHATFRRGYCAI